MSLERSDKKSSSICCNKTLLLFASNDHVVWLEEKTIWLHRFFWNSTCKFTYHPFPPFDFLFSLLIGIIKCVFCFMVVVGNTICENKCHYLCQVIHSLNHVHLCVISTQVLKYWSYFSKILFWIFAHLSSNTKLLVLIWSMDSNNLLPFFVASSMFLWIKK